MLVKVRRYLTLTDTLHIDNIVAIQHSKGYLVDPASSHMLVSKIKPCKSKYKSFLLMKLRTAH